MARKIEQKQGDLFEVPVTDGTRGFGHVLSTTMLGFFARARSTPLAVREIVASPVAFRVWGMKSALESGAWPIVGNAELSPAMRAPLRMCQRAPETGAIEHRVPREEITGLESEGLWPHEKLAERLAMLVRGEAHPWNGVD